MFFQSDQFAPKGYFGYAMTFVFLELRPPTPEEFPVQMLCLLFCTLVLIGALLLYARLSAPSTPPEEEITRGLTRLAELLEDDGWLTGSGADYLELELEDEKVNPKYGILTVKGYLQKARFAPDTTIELAGTPVGIYE